LKQTELLISKYFDNKVDDFWLFLENNLMLKYPVNKTLEAFYQNWYRKPEANDN